MLAFLVAQCDCLASNERTGGACKLYICAVTDRIGDIYHRLPFSMVTFAVGRKTTPFLLGNTFESADASTF